MKKTPITHFEKQLVAVVSRATFPPATATKRFIGDLHGGYITQLSDRGRWFLAFIANRFRRQYTLSAEQWAWVKERLAQKTDPLTESAANLDTGINDTTDPTTAQPSLF